MGNRQASWKANTSTILLEAWLENPCWEALRKKPLKGSCHVPLMLAVSREKDKSHQVSPNLLAASVHQRVICYLAQTGVTLPCPCHRRGTITLEGGESMLQRLKWSSIPPCLWRFFTWVSLLSGFRRAIHVRDLQKFCHLSLRWGDNANPKSS